MREALSILALILVGTPVDFGEHSPCEWVQEKSKNLQGVVEKWKLEDLLELLAHRVYMELYSRHEPTAVSYDETRDKWITEIFKRSSKVGEKLEESLKKVDRDFPKDAGPPRLGRNSKFLTALDPARNISWTKRLPSASSEEDVLRKIEGQARDISSVCPEHQGGLEKKLGELIVYLENEFMKKQDSEDVAKALSALYRWSTTYFLRYSGFIYAESELTVIIDTYLKLF